MGETSWSGLLRWLWTPALFLAVWGYLAARLFPHPAALLWAFGAGTWFQQGLEQVLIWRRWWAVERYYQAVLVRTRANLEMARALGEIDDR